VDWIKKTRFYLLEVIWNEMKQSKLDESWKRRQMVLLLSSLSCLWLFIKYSFMNKWEKEKKRKRQLNRLKIDCDVDRLKNYTRKNSEVNQRSSIIKQSIIQLRWQCKNTWKWQMEIYHWQVTNEREKDSQSNLLVVWFSILIHNRRLMKKERKERANNRLTWWLICWLISIKFTHQISSWLNHLSLYFDVNHQLIYVILIV